MDEKTGNKGAKEGKPKDDINNGDSSEADDLVTRANVAAERLEKITAQTNEIYKKMQEMEARNILGGRSTAGQEQEKPKEESPEEYARNAIEGKLNKLN